MEDISPKLINKIINFITSEARNKTVYLKGIGIASVYFVYLKDYKILYQISEAGMLESMDEVSFNNFVKGVKKNLWGIVMFLIKAKYMTFGNNKEEGGF